MNAIAELTDLADRSLLIVEDDKPFLERLSRAMETRGFAVTSCDTVTDGLAQINKAAPAFAVVDLRLGDGNGLDVVSALKRKRPDARTIVLTGYGNIATAVTAVKMGAVDYLSKPADADDVVAALLASGTEKSELPSNPMSADRVRWEHIQRIYEMCNRNVSETARRLNMHRRTLQRDSWPSARRGSIPWRDFVGWAKRSVPTIQDNGRGEMVGTLRFAHPTAPSLKTRHAPADRPND